jgi:hypothetical protein
MTMNGVLCIAIAIMACASYAIEYIGGRRGNPIAIGIFPAEIIPSIIGLLCLVALLLRLIYAFRKRRSIRKSFVLLALGFIIFSSSMMIPPTEFFIIGFRQRIQATVSRSELREIARVCQTELQPQIHFPGPQNRSLWNESKHRSKWDRLVNTTSLGKLDPWITIVNSGDYVEIWWERTLPGRWGLDIRTNAKFRYFDFDEGIHWFLIPYQNSL